MSHFCAHSATSTRVLPQPHDTAAPHMLWSRHGGIARTLAGPGTVAPSHACLHDQRPRCVATGASAGTAGPARTSGARRAPFRDLPLRTPMQMGWVLASLAAVHPSCLPCVSALSIAPAPAPAPAPVAPLVPPVQDSVLCVGAVSPASESHDSDDDDDRRPQSWQGPREQDQGQDAHNLDEARDHEREAASTQYPPAAPVANFESRANSTPLWQATPPLPSVTKPAYVDLVAETHETDPRIVESMAEQLFRKLDVDGDGRLDAEEVAAAVHRLGLPTQARSVKAFMRKMDYDNDNTVTLAEFKAFLLLHESALRAVYTTFHDNASRSSPRKLRKALHRLGVHLSSEQARKLHADIAAEASAAETKRNFHRFCTALLLLPQGSTDVFTAWLGDAGFDAGEQVPLPKDGSWRTAVAGAVGSVISRTMTAPMDRVKLVMQAATTTEEAALSIAGVFRSIYASQGLWSFWRGNAANCVKIAPETAVKMYAFENYRAMFAADPKDVAVHEMFMCGAAAGATAQCCIYPLEIAKTRLALSTACEYNGIVGCLGSTLRKEGLRALYRGLSASLTGIVPYAGTELTIITLLNNLWEATYPESTPGPALHLATGLVASTTAITVAYPLNLVRTLLQAQGMPGRPVVYDSMSQCFAGIVRSQGVRGLYRGMLPNMLKAVPAMGISYAAFATLKTLL